MDKELVLNEKSFKALSADSRINILKNLSDRRRTLSELSQKLNLGSSTIKEHCDILIDAELIKQIDEGRKWKYYELTQKGKQMVQPSLMDEVKVLIVLCASLLVVGGFVFVLLQSIGMQSATNTSLSSPNEELLIKSTSTAMIDNTSDTLAGSSSPQATTIISPEIIILALAAIIIIAGFLYLRKRKKFI